MSRQLILPGFHPWMSSPGTWENSLDPYPNVERDVLCERAREIGHAGELLVLSKLIRTGHTAVHLPDLHPFDLLLLRNDRNLRIQIKTTTRPHSSGAYRFTMAKGYRNNPMGTRPYAKSDYDLAALVILPEDCVLFTAERRDWHSVPVSMINQLRAFPSHSLLEALTDLGLAPSGARLSAAGS
ncbi:group I intron-associated PD-(D/E)XK endonuclease [Paracoccus jeotgali]|uniref:group I intron-associated PD-(D/E)XK endonuclease n=1 Tax=Paracoccus jeotgali TaxID=2065379 RepID=UPI0028AF65D9|nr:group I intron-associated PD-(D/E)XK endonuclease [Paracoccus jeotgali]